METKVLGPLALLLPCDPLSSPHTLGRLPVWGAHPLETCLPHPGSSHGVLMLETHAEAVSNHDAPKAPGFNIFYLLNRHLINHNCQEQLIADVGSLARQLGSTINPPINENDRPPQYEDLQADEMPPPQYESCVLQIRFNEENGDKSFSS